MSDLLQSLAERAVGPPAALRPRRNSLITAAGPRQARHEESELAVQETAKRDTPSAPHRQAQAPAAAPYARGPKPEPTIAAAPKAAPHHRVAGQWEVASETPGEPRTEVDRHAPHKAARRPRPEANEHMPATEPSPEPAAPRLHPRIEPNRRPEVKPAPPRVERRAAPELAVTPDAAKRAEIQLSPESRARKAVEVRTRRTGLEPGPGLGLGLGLGQRVVHVPGAAAEAREPEIRVTIGRLEMRAASAPERPAERRPRPPVPSLDEYLRRRTGALER
jgi:hypothetical protein